MEEAKFRYFLNGEEVDGKLINWEYSTAIISKGNDIYVEYAKEDEDKIYGHLEEAEECVFKDIFASILLNNSNRFKPTEDSTDIVESKEKDISVGEAEVLSDKPLTGVKHNKLKAPLDILQTRQFPKALQALALATAFGNKKYKDTDKDFLNFKRVPGGSQTYFDAAARHNVQRIDTDEDSGLPHLVHAVWNMLAALEISIEEYEVDIKEVSKEYLEYLHNSK